MTDELLKYVSYSDLQKGLNYDNRKVKYVGMGQDYDELIYRFIVSSEHTLQSYIVTIYTDTKHSIIDTSCTCPQYSATSSCKHVAASLIKYQGEYFLIDENDTADYYANNLLNEIKTVANNKTIIKKEAFIIPYFKLETHRDYYSYYSNNYVSYYELRFKIGSSKMYALGTKVNSFIDKYRNGGEVKFGKEFIYDNRNYYFNTESKKIINFIELAYSRLYRYDSYLIPTKNTLDDLFEIVDSVYVEAPFINRELPLIKGLPFNFKVTRENNTHTLNIDANLRDLTNLCSDYRYLIDKNGIYKLNEIESIIARNILEEEIDSLTFSDDRFKDVKDFLIPNIKDKVELDDSVDDLVIVKTPSVKLYFDILELYVECKIIFTYGDIEVNYLDKKDSDVIRDKEFERNVFLDITKYGF